MLTPDIARAHILDVLGGQYIERWPEEMKDAFLGEQKLTYGVRTHLAKFLYGNLRDKDLVYAAMRPQLGNNENHHQILAYLEAMSTGRYNQSWYFQVREQPDNYYLDGSLYVQRTPPNPCVRTFNAWESEVWRTRREHRRWPTLAEQTAFFTTERYESPSPKLVLPSSPALPSSPMSHGSPSGTPPTKPSKPPPSPSQPFLPTHNSTEAIESNSTAGVEANGRF